MSLLLTPFNNGNLFLHNRLVMPPMGTSKADPEGFVTPELLEYYDEKSRGGHIGLLIVEHSFVAPLGRAQGRQLSAAGPECLEGLSRLAETIHKNGGRAALQLSHGGSLAALPEGREAVGPSALPNPVNGKTPRELTQGEISEIAAAFVAGAKLARDAGFDGAELHSAHGYLLNEFFSPLTNGRTDRYGGSLENRLRLHKDILSGIRAELGESYPILVRLGCCDYADGGNTERDGAAAAELLAAAGADIIDVSAGAAKLPCPGMALPFYFEPAAAAVRAAVSVPVILAGGITEPEQAEGLLQKGAADLIGVGRAILEDSGWAGRAVKTLRGA